MAASRSSSARPVVAAAIIAGGRLLAARRSAPSSLAGGWELPGGKVETGESDQEALVRECHEELGVRVRPRSRVGGDWPLAERYVLRAWTAEILTGTPRPLEDHDRLRWLGAGNLFEVAWLPADRPIVAALQSLLRPASRAG